MKQLQLLIACLLLVFSVEAKADSWIDPTWRAMLDKSELIALIEYTTSGEFQAEAKIVKIYKGKLKENDLIWISGFSNRYGPIDKVEKGQRFVVFLHAIPIDENRTRSYEENLVENPSSNVLFEAYKNQRAFWMQSPTSGDLKVKGKTVQYDLTQTTFHQNQRFYSLKQFEQFLQAYFDRKKAPKVIAELKNRLIADAKPDQLSQHLMQLFFLDHDDYEEVYDEFADYAPSQTKYALAQILGNVRTQQSRNVLIKLLNDDDSLVQSEAVRQLKNESIDIIAPLFLDHLKIADAGRRGPSNLMDPVQNVIDGPKMEIIRAFSQLKYEPAVPHLLALLSASTSDEFRLIMEALKKIGTTDYIAHFNAILLQKNEKLAYSISSEIAENQLRDCLPSLKYFIANSNRNSQKNSTYTLKNLAQFKDKETTNFILFDYERFHTYADTLESDRQLDWTNAYIDVLADAKSREARRLIYESLYDWMGIGTGFDEDPSLFEKKKLAEATFADAFAKNPMSEHYKLSHIIAFVAKEPQTVMVEIVIPSEENPKTVRHNIAQAFGLETENVFIRLDSGIYYQEIQQRFDALKTPLDAFLGYAEAVPNPKDVAFLQALLDHGIFKREYQIENISNAIASIRSSLQ
ncbi:HEAT repeat domain-containing protein [Flavobacterium selenitireducens]|uniref:HEAT repeat domain-containing protein n=1 Tax=Flavobacterium selenitireducens TaxID=2722704 RepID=UPI00168BE3F6|nr:HEAT repeat domain-containing protein [Flavobacterium selenitireducens]MBD3582096.1 HEAT repeat domain-containing protein [Flavobacterium selenitireducens]